jgi:hypothetical protein
MVSKTRADQIAGGVFFIGLAILFITSFWWPGIMFVLGASAMARGVAEGKDWYSVPGGLWMIGIGLVFTFNFSWPVILILIGLSMLFGQSWRQRFKDRTDDSEVKAKNTDKAKRDTYILEDDDESDSATVEDLLRDEKRKNR